MRRLKILFVASQCPPTASGVGDYTVKLASAMARRGHEITVLTTSMSTSKEPSKLPVPVWRLIKRWDLWGVTGLCQALRTIEADLINLQYVPHAYGWGGINLALPAAVLWWRIALGKRVILTCHELYVPWRLHPKYLVQAIAHRIQLLLLMAGCIRMVVVTEGQRQRLQSILRWIPRPLDVVPVGATIDPTPGSVAQRALHRRRLAPHGEMLIGTFCLNRDPHLAKKEEDVIRILRQKGHPVRLIALGGNRSIAIRDPLSSWKCGTGYLPEKMLSGYLFCMDAVLNLRSEGPTTRNTSIISALAHGVPVVALGGTQPGQGGFWKNSGVIMAPDHPEAIVKAMECLLRDGSYRRRLAHQAKVFYRLHFEWSRIAIAIERISNVAWPRRISPALRAASRETSPWLNGWRMLPPKPVSVQANRKFGG